MRTFWVIKAKKGYVLDDDYGYTRSIYHACLYATKREALETAEYFDKVIKVTVSIKEE